MGVILAIYVACFLCTAFVGLVGMILFCEDGRQDEDFVAFKTVFVFAIIFPYAIYRGIKFKLNSADKRESE